MNKLVTIEREKLDPHCLYGVIVARSPILTLFHREYDFQLDGFMVVRTKDITRCDSSASNEYCQRLMRLEGLWKTVPRWVKKLSVGGWPELIADLVGKVVIFEDEARESFHIGPILEAQTKHVAVHHFDGCGRLKDVVRVPYSRITSMMFGDRYSTTHAKYLSSDGQPVASTSTAQRPKRKR
jgi:hypothetical protein